MTKLERICFCIVVSSLVPIATHAQITAKTAEPAPSPDLPTEIASPMQLDIPVATGSLQMPVTRGGVSWKSKETASYACDQAQVLWVSVEKAAAGKKNYKIYVRAKAFSDWFRQDVDFTLSLISGEKVVTSKHWDSYTLGPEEGAPFSGNPLQAETMVKIAREEFDEMLTSETPLVVRVVLRVLDD